MPIVALIAFLISVIIAYMSAQQLRGLGADIYVVDLVAIGVLRELGVLLTSIIVAGRSGSSFAAELGSMKLNEEVDALTRHRRRSLRGAGAAAAAGAGRSRCRCSPSSPTWWD